MRFLKNALLQRKITLVTMLTALSTLFIALVSLSLIETREFKKSLEQELKSIAGVTGGNSIAALEFLDKEAANRTLNVLEKDPRILTAKLFDGVGNEFASFRAAKIPVNQSEKDLEQSSANILIREPVNHQSKQIGTVQLLASGGQVLSRLYQYSIVAIIIGILSSVAAYFLSRSLRDSISDPILSLARTAAEVSRSKNFSLRVEKESNDETGQLVDQFNQMLAEVENTSRDLQASENQLRTITDSLPVLISYVDQKGCYQFNNAEYETWFGWELKKLKGRSVKEIVGDENFSRVKKHHDDALAGKTVQYEAEVFSKNLGKRFVSASLIPDIGDDRLVKGFFALLLDITERKSYEAEREVLLVSERAARSEAERASLLKDEFLATLSHELRTPLNAIVGWSQLLMKDPSSTQLVGEGIAVISRNAKSQAKLIADLLDLSSITSGKLMLDMQPINLANVLKSASEVVRLAASSKQIGLSTKIEMEQPTVLGDGARLEQVFWNLLTNSIKFTPIGGTVQISLTEPTSDWIEVRILDNGQGIDRNFLPHIFERFRQADASTTRKHGGLGIGLALVKQLIDSHGGNIRAESEGEGKGTTFVISLPKFVGNLQKEITPKEEGFNLNGLKVLLIDDEPDALDMLKRMLEKLNAKVLVAESAESGLDVLKSESPDIVLSDIGMPNYNGYDFIHWLEKYEEKKVRKTPSVAITAFARPEDKQKSLDAGFKAHLTKPVDLNELLTIIKKISLNH